jgi:hypothetical protein
VATLPEEQAVAATANKPGIKYIALMTRPPVFGLMEIYILLQ